MVYLLLLIGFALLIKGADLLVDGASSIAKKLDVSDLVIGLTVVAFGTSLPELFVNIFAGLQGNTDIAIGNVLGSNIANILLILGISAIIYPLSVKSVTVWKEIPLSLLAAILVAFMANDRLIDSKDFSALTRIDGFVLICFFIIFLYYIYESAKRSKVDDEDGFKKMSVLKSVIFIIIGISGLVLGGKWIVDSAVEIAVQFDLSQSLIGLTIVALGTSLPELATSAMAAYRKNTDIAIGNVVGSNIFNIFFILGISSSLTALPFSPDNNIDIAMTIVASILLFAFIFIGKRHLIERWQGILFIVIYAAYIGYLVATH